MQRSAKTNRRNERLLRLYILSEAYFKYQMFYLNQCVVNNNTDYKTAESTSMLINTIFNGQTKPADFIKTEDEATNEVIEKYKDYQKFLDKTYLDKSIVDAFCKASEHSFGTTLKINSTGFSYQIIALFHYNNGGITKQELQDALVDYCIFTKKTKKLNTKLFKKTVTSIEKLYTEILDKKIIRLHKHLKKEYNGANE